MTFVRSVRALSAAFLLACCVCMAHAALPTVPTPPAPAHEAASAVGGSGLLQAGFGMLAVLGLIFLCAWGARRFGLQRFGGGNLVKVVSSSMVGQRERVVVVEVGATWLVLGVTANQVNTLHTMPAEALPQAQALSGAPGATGSSPAMAASLKPLDLFAQKLREAVTGKRASRPIA